MAKISKHDGPTLGVANPATPAEVLQSRGKLGPYPEEREQPGTGEPMEAVEIPVDGEAEIVGDGSGVALPPAEETPEDPDTVALEAGVVVPQRPPVNASKADWVTYVAAVEHEDPAAISETYTKAELIEQYGPD